MIAESDQSVRSEQSVSGPERTRSNYSHVALTKAAAPEPGNRTKLAARHLTYAQWRISAKLDVIAIEHHRGHHLPYTLRKHRDIQKQEYRN